MRTERLDSLKEIAGYLQCDIRTLGRWEKERGLPLHRIPGGGRGRVFAVVSELDAWMRGQAAAELAADSRSLLAGPNPPKHPFHVAANGSAAVSEAAPSRKPRLGRWGFAFVSLAAVFAASLTLMPAYFGGRTASAVKVTAAGSKVRGWDAGGKPAWEYSFPEDQEVSLLETSTQPVVFTDLKGDGQKEALVALAIRTPATDVAPRDALYCFAATGKLLWSYQPQISLTFGEQRYEAPWQLNDYLVSPNPQAGRIWAAFGHHVWWPSFVVRLDAQGNAQLQYVNSGHILRLGYMHNSAGGFLLAGGHNNGYLDAGLAVLKEDQPFAHSPQPTGSPYACRSCPEGVPDLYILFPRLELNLALGIPYNAVYQIHTFEDRVEIATTEVASTRKWFFEGAGARYVFGSDFNLQDFSVDDSYWSMHRVAEQQGKVRHAAEVCPERSMAGHVRVLRAGQPGAAQEVLSARKN